MNIMHILLSLFLLSLIGLGKTSLKFVFLQTDELYINYNVRLKLNIPGFNLTL